MIYLLFAVAIAAAFIIGRKCSLPRQPKQQLNAVAAFTVIDHNENIKREEDK
ncbi:MAG: hypothetical protein J0H02_19550 [Armatimonadetes bacterium]|mgnify:CR=1 FL=1|nr:hypothetical protein [Armatimonadota bacterium]